MEEKSRRGRVTVIANLKGGVAKTTTAVNLACGLARGVQAGGENRVVPPQRVLLIDFESAETASSWLGVKADDPRASCAALFDDGGEAAYGDGAEGAAWDERLRGLCVRAPSEPIDVIPSSEVGVDITDGAAGESEYTLMDNLEVLRRHYDHILIDTPANAKNRMLRSALIASDGLIIPVLPSGTVLMSVSPLFTIIRDVRRGANRALAVDGWLISNAGPRGDRDAIEAQRALSETPEVAVFDTMIRSLKAISRSSWAGASVFAMEDAGEAQRDYAQFVNEWYHRVAGGQRG